MCEEMLRLGAMAKKGLDAYNKCLKMHAEFLKNPPFPAWKAGWMSCETNVL